jgi:hypothetical protein
LQRFQGLPGPYGTLEITAKSTELVELTLTNDFVQLNRADAHELVRVVGAWLSVPRTETEVVETHGARTTVVVKDSGPGAPKVVVVDDDAPPSSKPGHFPARPTERGR